MGRISILSWQVAWRGRLVCCFMLRHAGVTFVFNDFLGSFRKIALCTEEIRKTEGVVNPIRENLWPRGSIPFRD